MGCCSKAMNLCFMCYLSAPNFSLCCSKSCFYTEATLLINGVSMMFGCVFTAKKPRMGQVGKQAVTLKTQLWQSALMMLNVKAKLETYIATSSVLWGKEELKNCSVYDIIKSLKYRGISFLLTGRGVHCPDCFWVLYIISYFHYLWWIVARRLKHCVWCWLWRDVNDIWTSS